MLENLSCSFFISEHEHQCWELWYIYALSKWADQENDNQVLIWRKCQVWISMNSNRKYQTVDIIWIYERSHK